MIRIPETSIVYTKKLEYVNVGGQSINFQRTCRVAPGEIHPLPAGLGSFPIYKVSDFRSGTPKEWRDDSFFMPMYRQEAMWINFRGNAPNPKAMIIAAGNINAVTGKPFDLSKTEKSKRTSSLDVKLEADQNYVVMPPQPWVDGWKAEDGKIYQFVAAELGSGETVEGQITGEEKVGGIQLIVYDPKPGQKLVHKTRPHEYVVGGGFDDVMLGSCAESFSPKGPSMLGGVHIYAVSASVRSRGGSTKSVQGMGLGRGGEIAQKIYPDPYGLQVWNETPTGIEVLNLVSSEDFKQVTGYDAPPTPVTYEKYQELGMPWFELHDVKFKDVKGGSIFDKLKPVGEGKAKK